MNISSKGISLIKQFEGCKLKAYQDQVGVWTIGYGHTGPKVGKDLVWTQRQCDEQLEIDLEDFCEHVEDAIGTAIVTQGQFDAMTSFAYNLGIGALKRSNLLKKLASGDVAGAADEFLKWNLVGGKENAGITRRRTAERALFLS